MNVTLKFGWGYKKFCVTTQGSAAAMPAKPKTSKSFPYQKIWASENTYEDLQKILIKGGGEGHILLLERYLDDYYNAI